MKFQRIRMEIPLRLHDSCCRILSVEDVPVEDVVEPPPEVIWENHEQKSIAADMKTQTIVVPSPFSRNGFQNSNEPSAAAFSAAEVTKTMQTGFDEIKRGIAEVGEKVSQHNGGGKGRGKRRVKYDDATVAYCLGLMDAGKKDEAIKSNLNTRVTYRAVFNANCRELEERKVPDVATFKSILRAGQARARRAREARQNALAAPTQTPKYGIIHGMLNTAKSALAGVLLIVGGLAAMPLSAASVTVEKTPPPIPANAALYAPRSASDAPSRTELRGRVVKVADGDTLTILGSGNTQYKIRLYGIDAPEKSQAFGQKSKEQLSKYVYGKDVFVRWKSKDKYGRILGVVYLGTTDINLAMLRDGMAWHYKRFDSTPAYAAAESDARQNRRGLWADKNPIEPEKFRHPDRAATKITIPRTPGPSMSAGASVPQHREEYFAGSAMPVGSRKAAPVCDKWPDTGFWLSTNSNKRHNRNCENYRKTRGYPCSSSDGTPCGKCGG